MSAIPILVTKKFASNLFWHKDGMSVIQFVPVSNA